MQGDPKVDELMRPVLAAIKRHVKNSDATTDIYNRAYEAVMNSVDVKTGKTYCAYCGAEYPLDDNAATLVSEHIKMCEKHPMRAVEAELRKWQTGEIVGIEFVPKMFNELELKNARANARAEAAEARAERLQAALQGLMQFHPEDELGPQTEEYWTPEYKAAMGAAHDALKGGEG